MMKRIRTEQERKALREHQSKLVLKRPPISDKENERLESISFDNQRLI